MNRDNDLLRRIHALQATVREFKTSQPVGSDSVQTYTSMTNDEWDVVWVATSNFGDIFNSYDIRWEADHQAAPFGRLRVIADFNGAMYDPTTRINGSLTPKNVLDYFDSPYSPSIEDLDNPKLLNFVVNVRAVSVGTIVRLKFLIDATDTGRFTWKAAY